MKTLKQITLTATLIILSVNFAIAGNTRTFEVQLSNGKVMEITSKVEQPVEESIPGHAEFINSYRMSKFEITGMPVYTESLVEEELPVFNVKKENNNDEYLGVLLSSISKPEQEVEDNFGFDTREVFAEIRKEKNQVLTNGKLAKFIKTECEVTENLFIVCAGFLSAK
ncbi:MAG: hypothetical protein EA393_16650 [Bacteroidetes bacterium]|nr:MAG: hypothetical protein EA393_16650 [Bacteroidota bacterium]